MKITYNTFSEKGPRNENQDHIRTMTDAENGRYSFVLCDGMGGHAMGGTAAKIVAASICRDIMRKRDVDEGNIRSMISRAAWTLDTMSDVYGGIQMGTTMVMAHINGNRLTIAHCGDSRCYVFDHCGKAKYVTTDHNAGECIGAPLTRGFFTGQPDMAVPDLFTMTIESGDRVFLCSDGLWSSIRPDILRDRMLDDKEPEDIMDTYKFLCEKYAEGNYSAILITIE